MPYVGQARPLCYIFLAFYSLHITPRLINQRLTVFTHTARSVFVALDGNTCRLIAFRAYQHHIRDINGSLELDSTGVDIATRLSLHLLLVLGADIYTLDNHTTIL